jgi:hypothetical protein
MAEQAQALVVEEAISEAAEVFVAEVEARVLWIQQLFPFRTQEVARRQVMVS